MEFAFDARVGGFFAFPAAESVLFFEASVFIRPPKEPRAPWREARGEPVCRESRMTGHRSEIPSGGKTKAERRGPCRRRCELRGHRLRGHAWQLPVSESCRRKRRGTEPGARSPGK